MPQTARPVRPALTLAAAQLRADLRHRRTGKRSAGRLAATGIAYGFSGTVLALSLGSAPAEHALFVGSSFGMVLAAFGLVGSYDEVMGRPRDNAWLTTLPATEGAFYLARLLGIGVYVGLMAGGVGVPVGVRVGVSDGAALGLVVGGAIALAVVWTALGALAVLWGLTLALPSRPLRLALGVARTVLIAALVLGFQLVGAQAEAASAPWWPGAWLADALSGRPTVGLGLLGASVLLFAVLFGVVFRHRYFRLLRRLADGARSDGKRLRLGRDLSAPERWAARPGPLRAAYGFAVAAFADDRIVRGRLWPAALLPAGFVAFGWLSGGLGSVLGVSAEVGAIQGTFAVLQSSATQLHLSILVVLLFCVQSLVQTLQHSDHAEGAWVFAMSPDAWPRALQVGAQQALAWRVLLPLHVGIAVLLTLAMPAADAVLHAAFWLGVSVLVALLYAVAHRAPPFSRRSDRFSAAGRLVPIVVSIPGGVGLLMFQVWAFATPSRATLATVTMLGAWVLIGAAVAATQRPRPAALTPLGPSG